MLRLIPEAHMSADFPGPLGGDGQVFNTSTDSVLRRGTNR